MAKISFTLRSKSSGVLLLSKFALRNNEPCKKNANKVLYCTVLYCIVLCRILLYCIVSYCIIVLYCVVLYYCIVLCRILLYCTVLYCIALYCIVSYCIVLLYRIVLYRIALYCIKIDFLCFENLRTFWTNMHNITRVNLIKWTKNYEHF